MQKIGKYIGQAVIYAGIMAVLGVFANSPTYKNFDGEYGLIRLTLSHGGRPKGGCRKQTREELEKIAPNMRRKQLCSRERLPVLVEMAVDDKQVFSKLLQPTGLRNDGPARLYEGVRVTTGSHKIVLKLRDSDRADGFDYERTATVEIKPRQHFVVQFRAEFGGFVF